MSNKQSNTQSVKVVVNNKIHCCDDKKKKRKPRKKQQPQEQPIDEFPVLNTPINSRYPQAGIAPMAVRNSVYIPSAMQITPEGISQPVPEYFNRHYTNLVRTMEDFKSSMMNEIQDVRNLVSIQPPTAQPPMTPNEPPPEINNNYDSPVKQKKVFYENLSKNNEDDENVPFEEKPFVAQSPKQDKLYNQYKKLYDDRDKMIMKNDKQGKDDIEEEIKSFAESIGVSLTYDGGRKRGAHQLRRYILDKINSIT